MQNFAVQVMSVVLPGAYIQLCRSEDFSTGIQFLQIAGATLGHIFT